MEWIKVTDRLPSLFDFVLVLACNKGTDEPKPISIARRMHDNIWDFCNKHPSNPNYGAWMDLEYNMECEDITHWMPLPKPPED